MEVETLYETSVIDYESSRQIIQSTFKPFIIIIILFVVNWTTHSANTDHVGINFGMVGE
jgi:hypothetical protein